jgi:hypothetical protein
MILEGCPERQVNRTEVYFGYISGLKGAELPGLGRMLYIKLSHTLGPGTKQHVKRLRDRLRVHVCPRLDIKPHVKRVIGPVVSTRVLTDIPIKNRVLRI